MGNNKIILRFQLTNRQKIGFEAENLQQDHFEGLQSLHENGISINAAHYDDLCKNTISNGHDLLKSKGIFNIDTAVVNPMSTVIGRYLFRLLFGDTEFEAIFHWARKEGKEMEIVLEFDLNNKESKELAILPWELMYCPDSRKNTSDETELEDDVPDGFFISQVASIYRRYEQVSEKEIDVKREVWVSVAFLTKDIENLKEVYSALKKTAAEVEEKNNNLHFEFMNPVNEQTGDVYLLTKERLGKIFLSEKNKASPEVNKIVHLICDVSTTVYNGRLENSLYFHKIGNETESISYKAVFQELFNKIPQPDTYLKMVVLQAWKDENRYAYSGFEELAHRIQKNHKTALISMPYVLNQRQDKDGKATFFETLYSGLADSLSTTQVVQKLRNVLVQEYSYGFPLLYLKGQDLVLVSIQKPTTASQSNRSKGAEPDAELETYKQEYQFFDKNNLEGLRKDLEDKLKFLHDEKIKNYTYSIKVEITETEKRLKAIDLELEAKLQTS